MVLNSKVNLPIFIKYPLLKWIAMIVSIPIVIMIYLLLPLMLLVFILDDTYTFDWIILFIMIIFSYIIPYSHMRRGWGSKQVLEYKDESLIVTNKWFIFKHTKQYSHSSIKLVELSTWNYLTGRSMNLKTKYASLIINDNTTLHHFYKLEELENFTNEIKK